MPRVFDACSIGDATKRTRTPENFLKIKDCVVGRAGNVQRYHTSELDLDGDRMVALYRPPSEVFSQATVDSGEDKPFTEGHPKQQVTADNWNQLAHGEMRNVKAVPRPGQVGDLLSDIIAKTKSQVSNIEAKKIDALSLGYEFELDMTPGTSPETGEAYDGVQRNIRINHVALVDVPRGKGCRISDSEGATSMSKVIVIDGKPHTVADESAPLVEAIAKENSDLKKQIADSAGKFADELAEERKATIAKDTEITELKKRLDPKVFDAEVSERVAVITKAVAVDPKIVVDGKSVHELRLQTVNTLTARDSACREVAEAITNAKDFSKASEGSLKIAFDAVTRLGARKTARTNDAAALMAGGTKIALVTGRDGDTITTDDTGGEDGEGAVIEVTDAEKFVGPAAWFSKKKEASK